MNTFYDTPFIGQNIHFLSGRLRSPEIISYSMTLRNDTVWSKRQNLIWYNWDTIQLCAMSKKLWLTRITWRNDAIKISKKSDPQMLKYSCVIYLSFPCRSFGLHTKWNCEREISQLFESFQGKLHAVSCQILN